VRRARRLLQSPRLPQLTLSSLKFKGDKTSVGKKRKRAAGESSDAVAKRNKDKAVPEFDESDMDGWMDLVEPEACVRLASTHQTD